MLVGKERSFFFNSGIFSERATIFSNFLRKGEVMTQVDGQILSF